MRSVFLDLPKGRDGAVRLSLQAFRGAVRVDLREMFIADQVARELRPTRRGTGVPIGDLPRLREAMQTAEIEALAAGLISTADYHAAGLKPPVPSETKD